MKPVTGVSASVIGSARSFLGRFGWGIGDQALSSLTNFGLGLVAARSLAPVDFGAFAVVFAGYVLALGAARAITSEPFVIRYAAVTRDEWRQGAAEATGSATMIGFVAGAVSVIASLFLEGPLRTGFLTLGVTLPGLLLQDTWRFVFFASRRGRSAFLNDLVWGVSLVLALTFMLLSGLRTTGWLILAWGGAGTVAGIFGMLQASTVPVPRRTMRWIRRHRDLIPRFLGEVTTTSVVGQVTVFAVGAIAGLADVGSLRAGQILLGPLNVLFLGVNIVAVPEGVRELQASSERLLRLCRRLAIGLAACALLLGAGLWPIPEDLGTALLRENWLGARSVLVPLALGMGSFGVLLGAGIGLRSLAAARLSLRAKLLTAPLSLAGGVAGAAVNGALGAAWGMTLGMTVGAVIWWRYLRIGLVDHRPAPKASSQQVAGEVPTDQGGPYG